MVDSYFRSPQTLHADFENYINFHSTNTELWLLFLYNLTAFVISCFIHFSHLTGVSGNLKVALICISLIIKNDENILSYSLDIFTSSI